LSGTDGTKIDLGAKGTTVVFLLLADCPIAQKYSPEIRRISKEFRPKNVRFVGAFVDPDITAANIETQLAAFQLPLKPAIDKDWGLAKRLDIRIAPTAVVIQNGEVRYQGRIDDRFPSVGIQRTPRTRDLRDAIVATLAGKPVTQPKTEAVGCTFRLD
jgi:hypothetical protein